MRLVEADDLVVAYRGRTGSVRALDGVDLGVDAGEIVGIVGESGSGKSTLGMAIGALLPRSAEHVRGDLRVGGTSVWGGGAERRRLLRSRVLGFVFQSPLASLDPTMRVGRQMAMQLADHGLPIDVAGEFRRVGLDDADRVAESYPHQLSGGMAQRVAIALALAPSPDVVVADEPTASLDSTVRRTVMDAMVTDVRSRGATLVLLSHDLQMVRATCDRVVVMYGGRIVEDGRCDQVLATPEHPYARALLAAAPGLERPGERIAAIDGSPPVLQGECPGCAFALRCPEAEPRCHDSRPAASTAAGRLVVCHRRPSREATDGMLVRNGAAT